LKLNKRNLKRIYEIERKVENSVISYPVTKIKSNPYFPNILAVSYEDGILDLYKLSDDLCTNKSEEMGNFNKMITQLIN
jgi:hypothetical protein